MKSFLVVAAVSILAPLSVMASGNLNIDAAKNTQISIDVDQRGADLTADFDSELRLDLNARPGGHGGPGWGPGGGHGGGWGPGHGGGHHGGGWGPGHGGGWGPGGGGHGPGWQRIVCYAENLRGMRFSGMSFDRRRAEYEAMDQCMRHSYRCRPIGCQRY